MSKVIRAVDRLLQKYLPDPFVIAIALTVVTLVGACFVAEPPADGRVAVHIIRYWGDGFWSLAEFTLQMAMILIGGYVVATSRPVQTLLRQSVSVVRSPTQAVLFCTLASLLASWINWGFGLVAGAMVALEVGRRHPQVPFRVLVASSYSGFLVWHGGLSASIPLVLNTKGKVSSELTGELIPLTQTLFSPLNLIALGAMVVLLPIINLIHLKSAHDEPAHFEPTSESGASQSVAGLDTERGMLINHSFLPVGLLFALASSYWLVVGSSGDFRLNLNSVIFIFFMVGMLLHGTPDAFVRAVGDATPKIAPILIQYPLYAGIMVVLEESGMAAQISQLFVDYSTPQTFPLMTFYSAGLLNLLVPSGGGQWAVQAPIVVEAAQKLGVDVPRVAMAVAWGDAWTNLAQPFWAIPLLTIAGLSIRDIMGFCLVTLLASGVVLSLIFLCC